MATIRLQSAATVQTAVLHDVDVDMVLSDSFPASDPPSWTGGMAEAGRATIPTAIARPLTRLERPEWLRTVGSVLGTIVVVLAFPLFVVGLPFALAWRLVLQAGGWGNRPG
jgi:hypothetical protein